MRILLNGCRGFMGREVISLCERGYRGATLAAGIDPSVTEEDNLYRSAREADTRGADVIIDFSHHSAAPEICALAVNAGLPIVVATTGHTEAEKEAIADAARCVPVFYAANMSVGVALLCELAKKAAIALPDADIEIVETHHTRKLDAPSKAVGVIHRRTERRPDRRGIAPREYSDKLAIGCGARRTFNPATEVAVSVYRNSHIISFESDSRKLCSPPSAAALFCWATLAAGAAFCSVRPRRGCGFLLGVIPSRLPCRLRRSYPSSSTYPRASR